MTESVVREKRLHFGHEPRSHTVGEKLNARALRGASEVSAHLSAPRAALRNAGAENASSLPRRAQANWRAMNSRFLHGSSLLSASSGEARVLQSTLTPNPSFKRTCLRQSA